MLIETPTPPPSRGFSGASDMVEMDQMAHVADYVSELSKFARPYYDAFDLLDPDHSGEITVAAAKSQLLKVAHRFNIPPNISPKSKKKV